jgi:hypothetical protein
VQIFDAAYIDDDGVTNMTIVIYYYKNDVPETTTNMTMNAVGDLAHIIRSGPVTLSFDMYNDFDKNLLPIGIGLMDMSSYEDILQMLEDTKAINMAAITMGITSRDLAKQVVRAIDYGTEKGWFDSFSMLQDPNKLDQLIGRVLSAYLYLTGDKELSSVAIPDHYDNMLTVMRRTNSRLDDTILIMAMVAAVDDIILVGRPS